jgi:hypothetical protein
MGVASGWGTTATPWPGLGAAANDLNTYTRASVLLKGEQNSVLPCKGCEQHAAPYTPQNFLLPSSLDAHMCGIMPDPHLEVLKLPNWNNPPLEEPERVFLRPIHMDKKAGAEASECVQVDVHELGGASLDANPAPPSTEGTASIELAGGAIKATTAQPKVLDPWAKSKAWHRLGMLLLPLP